MASPTEDGPSDRELAVLSLIVPGWTNREIGARLSCTEETVKKHVSALLRKLRAANRAELAARAVALGLVTVPSEDEKKTP
jgi:DNA-binding NarL/FixJ family response regulator